ncbi:helix-turn-helix domain-containing protein [Bacillus sp. Marseille-P3661]|uniref:helix-turn-helix domain-containing protein n=1 Tax=Bacillus sp. Marseille-P3661 TaxID=1936234 RepID=UPI000C85024F|nr:helix-turn-helix transcriptional regulator [Bacillus sp. Marseille-P3661]
MYANRLRELRIEHGYTMEEVGKKVGIKKSSYASYESRYRQPPLEKLKGFSKLYGVSVDYILGLTNVRSTEESIQVRLKDICVKRGLHWDGVDIPEDVLILIEKVLDEAVLRSWVPTQSRKEG